MRLPSPGQGSKNIGGCVNTNVRCRSPPIPTDACASFACLARMAGHSYPCVSQVSPAKAPLSPLVQVVSVHPFRVRKRPTLPRARLRSSCPRRPTDTRGRDYMKYRTSVLITLLLPASRCASPGPGQLNCASAGGPAVASRRDPVPHAALVST